ncbi:N-succinylarginine dihydrolase, partial [Helicobacter suis]|uniref:N-succinylarginine dihydrolase n=1 Tax=Helicobacter suis TaxID=104628 RepID=UPI0013D6FA89
MGLFNQITDFAKQLGKGASEGADQVVEQVAKEGALKAKELSDQGQQVKEFIEQGQPAVKEFINQGQEAVKEAAEQGAQKAKEFIENAHKASTMLGANAAANNQSLEGTDTRSQDKPLDFNQYLLDQNANQSSLNEEQTTKPRPTTGIKDLDNKIANRNLSAFDYLIAKNLGINLNVALNGSLELNQKIANRTQAVNAVYKTLQALDLGDNIMHKVQDNSGFINGVKRILNHKSGGIVGINSDLAQTDNAINRYIYSVADATTSGKITNQAVNDARASADIAFRSARENSARIAELQNIHLTRLLQQIDQVKALGGRVPGSVYLKLMEHQNKVKYVNENGGKIDIKAYDKLGYPQIPTKV